MYSQAPYKGSPRAGHDGHVSMRGVSKSVCGVIAGSSWELRGGGAARAGGVCVAPLARVANSGTLDPRKIKNGRREARTGDEEGERAGCFVEHA